MNKWYKEPGYLDDVVLSTRIRLARNLKNITFPSKINDEQAKKVIENVENAVNILRSYGLNAVNGMLDD